MDAPDVPGLDGKGKQRFTAIKDYWWGEHTHCQEFNKEGPGSKRHFGHQVVTDAVSASLLFYHPLSPAEATAALAADKLKNTKRKKPAQQTSTEWVKGWSQAGSSLDNCGRIVGLDPGRKELFTAVVYSHQAASSLPDAIRPHPAPYETLSWSSSRWQEASGIKHRQLKTALYMQQERQLMAQLEATPTAKVSTFAAFMPHVAYRLTHISRALEVFGSKKFRQLRWHTYRKRQQAYASMCNAITDCDSSTVVAFGDAKFSSSSGRGNPSTPTVSLRRKLGQYCKVVDVDEFRTSQRCSSCLVAMEGMPLPVAGEHLPALDALTC